MTTKICTKCKKELPLTSFYSRGNGKYRSECKECHRNYVKEKYQERKEQVSSLKEEKGCQKCGDKRSYVLDYHHIDPLTKEATIARITSNNNKIENIQKEIEKCVVLCANCHREYHYFKNKYNISIEDYLAGSYNSSIEGFEPFGGGA